MARVRLRGIPISDAQRQALSDIAEQRIAMDDEEVAAQQALGEYVPSLPAAAGDDEEIVIILTSLRHHSAAKQFNPPTRGRPYDPETLITAAEAIMAAGCPLSDGSNSRAVNALINGLGMEMERSRTLCSRLVEHAIRLGLREPPVE